LADHDLVLEAARLPDGRVAAIGIANGRIAAIGIDGAPAPSGRERIDLRGALVLPGLIDGHVHLDKTLIGDRWWPHRIEPCGAFDVRERVALEKEILRDALPIAQRAAALIELAVARGTTHMRSHVDVDPQIGLSHLREVRAVCERYRDAVSVQLVAFPQSGVLTCPGTLELMDAALAEGAALVGGLDPAGFDGDADGQLRAIFALAVKHAARVDIHLHDPSYVGLRELDDIAQRTRTLGLQGRVTVSHAYALGMVPAADARRTAENLAEAGVAILTNAPGNHAYPSVAQLRAAGVTVISGNDNIRDAWWPYGDADMLERAMLVGYGSGFLTDETLLAALDTATHGAARVLGVADDYGVRVGALADLVVVDARNAAEAVVARPPRRYVFKAGRVVARDGQFVSPNARTG
jgi:cytosine deaminase